MAMIQFLRGTQAGLAAKETINGALYFTTDTHKIYMGTETGKQEFSAIEVVSAVGALPSVATAIKGKFYYAEAENVFCFPYNGEWKQVNPDTGATSIEVVAGGGNAISAASYDALTRKITLTKGETFATPAVVDGKISDKVGTLKIGDTTYDTVVAYVNKKAEDTLSAAQGGSSETAASVKAALDNYKTENDAKVQANANAIKAIQDDYLKASDKEALQASIDAKADKTDLTALSDKVGTVPADKTVVGLISDAQTQANKGVADAAAAKAAADAAQSDVDALEGKVGTVPDGKTIVSMIAEAQANATYNDSEVRGLISNNATAIADVKSDVDAFLEAADIGGDAIDTLKEIQNYITTDGAAADQMVKDIAANKKAIEDEAARADSAEKANAAAASAAKAAADAAQTDVNAIKADYLKSTDKAALEGSISGVSNRVKAIEDKNISDGANKVEKSDINGNIKIDGTETVVYTHPAAHAISEVTGLQDALDAKATVADLNTTNANVTANSEAITALQSGKADKATTLAGYGITDAYTKSETYTQAQVDALLTWGTF